MINIHENSKKYLRFYYNGLYEFNVLPFGLNTAPYVFTKIMKPVVRLLRSLGHLSTIYLDDLLLIGNSHKACLENISDTVKLLNSLGFLINNDKSSLNPKTQCKYLGFIIDTERFQISLPVDKKEKIKSMVQKFRHIKRCKISDFAQFLGLLTSACPAVEYGWLYTKGFERAKFLNLKVKNDNYDDYMTIPDNLQTDLQWWERSITNCKNKIKTDSYCIEIYSDASTTGWGAACDGKTASGPWSSIERTKHINYLEILAALFGLKVFAKDLIIVKFF